MMYRILVKCVVICCYCKVFVGMAQIDEVEFDECHDDVQSDPEDFSDVNMRFPWLAFLQYVRIKDGGLYHGRVPRVVLVHRQYVLATAADVIDLPSGHALGNIVFKEYDRDEEECGVGVEELRSGAQCEPSELITPVSDVVLHPDHSDHNSGDGVALLKLAKRVLSDYVMPICLPYFDIRKGNKQKSSTFVVDFNSKIPITFEKEIKHSRSFHVLPESLCNRFMKFKNVSEARWSRTLCTAGCGMEPGAPLVAHLDSGWWVVVGLATHPKPCHDPDVWRTTHLAPSQFVNVLPYVDWISNMTTGFVDPRFSLRTDLDNPFGYGILRYWDMYRSSWSGRTYRYGGYCFLRNTAFKHYYSDLFGVRSDYNGDVFYFLNLQPETDYKVACVKIELPNRFFTPIITGMGHWNVSVEVPGVRYVKDYTIVTVISAIASTPEEKERWQKEKTAKYQHGSVDNKGRSYEYDDY